MDLSRVHSGQDLIKACSNLAHNYGTGLSVENLRIDNIFFLLEVFYVEWRKVGGVLTRTGLYCLWRMNNHLGSRMLGSHPELAGGFQVPCFRNITIGENFRDSKPAKLPSSRRSSTERVFCRRPWAQSLALQINR